MSEGNIDRPSQIEVAARFVVNAELLRWGGPVVKELFFRDALLAAEIEWNRVMGELGLDPAKATTPDEDQAIREKWLAWQKQ